MQNAPSMCRVQRIGHLYPEVQQLGVRHGPPVVELLQALPLQQFHHNQGLIAAFVQLVNSTDTGMI